MKSLIGLFALTTVVLLTCIASLALEVGHQRLMADIAEKSAETFRELNDKNAANVKQWEDIDATNKRTIKLLNQAVNVYARSCR